MDPQPHRRKPPTLHDTRPSETESRRGPPPPSAPPRLASDETDPEPGIRPLDILRLLAGLLLLSSALSYFVTRESLFWNYRPTLTRPGALKARLVRASPSLPAPSLSPHLPLP